MWQECKVCDGTGYSKCKVCRDDIYILCTYCNAEYIWNHSKKDFSLTKGEKDCEFCGGGGLIRCPECYNNRTVCYSCGGSGSKDY